ncbi:HAD-IC family P-type ATPase [Schaalia cardiffensis]|uniref:HAD-IC family P-type ATPase n=1 Tax=Schaalia cardiffensis TaxID=181487 RepID=UPI0018E859D7|nr:HAD-IC family P-type ATPase [Schaalia cardiffensis]MBJ2328198.1 HAD-IC family P-type ATPase [Schaalia cardiffensis]
MVHAEATQIQGLSEAEVLARVEAGQTNHVRQKTSRSLRSIIRENIFTLFNAILVGAATLVLIFGHAQDVVFGAVMVFNAIIGIVSEVRAKRTLDALAILDAPQALVVREGEERAIPTGDVVLDDVLVLKLGEQVCADGIVLDSSGLEVNESILTGESAPVRKHEGDEVLSGTSVVAGSALVRTTAVGSATYAQGISRKARAYIRTVSHIQVSINRVLRVISALLIPVIILTLWSQTRIADSDTGWNHAIVLAVASVVGMIPQGLVLLTSLNFAIGSATLARRGVLVQELAAVEVLARVDALCLDKTGTLTTGEIVAKDIVLTGDEARGLVALRTLVRDRTNETARAIADYLDNGGGGEAERRLEDAGLGEPGNGGARGEREQHGERGKDGVHEGREQHGEGAELRTNGVHEGRGDHGQHGIDVAREEREEATWVMPFSSARKWSAFGNEQGAWYLGAPEILSPHSQDSSQDSPFTELIAARTREGMRVVALAHSPGAVQSEELPKQRDVVGIVVLAEELRPDAKDTLDYFAQQKVRVRVISGDNPATVGAIATRAGLGRPDGEPLVIADARDLPDDLLSDEFQKAVITTDVFGRVTPEQKRAMVQALQADGHCVAMTGDGVNDALALKDADLGIAMGNGAQATKAVAQLVLVDSKFSVLPGVVAEGRRIIANMERVSALFLAKTVYAAVIVFACAILALQYPFLPRHFTYIDAFTIGIPAFFLALAPNSRRYVPGFLKRTLALAVPAGVILSAAALSAYLLIGSGRVEGQTGATLSLMIGAVFLLSVTARPFVSWRVALLAAMIAASVLGVLIPFTRHFFALEWPSSVEWGIIIACGVLAALLIEISHRAHHGRIHARAEAEGRA